MSELIQRDTLDAIAACLEYPHDGAAEGARAAADALEHIDAEASAAFRALAKWLDEVPRDKAEEIYTSLFDLQPSCTLHLGHHVFGEAYQRGAMLAELVKELRDNGIDQGTELADYLPTVLRLIGRVPDDEYRQLFIDTFVAVGLSRMQRELKAKPTPWAQAVAALGNLFGAAEAAKADDSLEARITREVASHA